MRTKEEINNLTSNLFTAIQNKKIDNIKSLIEKGADLASQNNEKQTPIQYARSLSRWECIEAIANCKKTDEKDTYYYNDALIIAAHINRYDTVKSLLKAGASTTWMIAGTEDRPLHCAVTNKNTEMIKLLLEHSADPSQTNKAGQTPITLACTLGYWACTDIFVQVKLPKFQDSAQAGLAFIDAVKAGKLTLARALFDAGISTTEQTQTDGNTCLHWVVKQWAKLKNNAEMLHFVLEHGGSQTTQNNDNKTPIELGSELGYWDCVQLLLEFGKNDRDNKQKIIELHYEHALIHAIKQGNYAITKLLLENNAPCGRWNSEMGNIALYWAVKNNNSISDMVSLLLKHGADPNIKNKKAETTYDLAKQLGHTACLKRLQASNSGIQPSPICSLLKLLSTGLNSVEKYRQEAENLYDSLCENGLKAAELSTAIKCLTICHQQILTNDLERLKARRNALRSNTTGQMNYLTQSLDINSELGKLNAVIQTICNLLNYPYKPLQLAYLLNPNSPEGADIQLYLLHKQKIDEYTHRIHIFLSSMNSQISQSKLKVKFFGLWVDGVPEPIMSLQNNLKKLSKTPSSDEIFQAYEELIKLLTFIAKLEGVHESTHQFYHKISQQIASNTFLPTNTESIYPIQLTQQTPLYIPANYYYPQMAAQSNELPPSYTQVMSNRIMSSEINNHPQNRYSILPEENPNDPTPITPQPLDLLTNQPLFHNANKVENSMYASIIVTNKTGQENPENFTAPFPKVLHHPIPTVSQMGFLSSSKSETNSKQAFNIEGYNFS
jgi:ankyrin repeat protein